MQQHSRGTSRPVPVSNIRRSSTQREQTSGQSSDFESIPYSGQASIEANTSRPFVGDLTVEQQNDLAKLKQITQRFFTKAALTIVSSRVDLPQQFHRETNQLRTNKWFNLLQDESDQVAKDVMEWATMDVHELRSKPMIIEIYLDTAELARNQTVVIIDERGTKWDVRNALEGPGGITTGRSRSARNTLIVLERWKISVGDSGPGITSPESPPNVYKRAVVLFRALYSYLHLMPTWKLGRRIAKEPASLTSLQPTYRILTTDQFGRDTLALPLFPSNSLTTATHIFPATRCSTGPLQLEVTYRLNCDFHINDSDAAVSSHFMGMDEKHFRPSLAGTPERNTSYMTGLRDVGSLPVERTSLEHENHPEQVYGSLSTFHRTGTGQGTSPLSALRAAGARASRSPSEGMSSRFAADSRAQQNSRSSPRSSDSDSTAQRRVSVSFQPFKAGSLSSSPGFGPLTASSPRSVGVGTSDISRALVQSRNRTSLTTLPQAALRVPSHATSDIVGGSPSPTSTTVRPTTTRFSSSFSNRRSRMSISSGTASRAEEETAHSLRGSQSSSNRPESGILAGADSSSSGSLRTDDDNIADFLKMLDKTKELKSFGSPEESTRDPPLRRTSVALNKYQRLRDSHMVLNESINSSVMLPPTSSSPSRVPPLLAGRSVSTSSSPGKPISPHTPHYPAIPSRLSANATVSETAAINIRQSSRVTRGRHESSPDEVATSPRRQTHGTIPMDIPTSPQRYTNARRSSSAAQRRRAREELDEFGLRSSSLRSEDRPDLSLAELLEMQQRMTTHPVTVPGRSRTESRPIMTEVPEPSSADSQESPRPVLSSFTNSAAQFRSRMRGGGRGSPSSFGGTSGESSRAGRHSGSGRPGTADDDEPLVFTMSEIGAQSKRGGDDMEGSSDTGRGDRGSGDLGPSARRGSRRGGPLW